MLFFQSQKNDGAELSQKICAAVEKRHGFIVKVIIFDVDQLEKAIALNPFAKIVSKASTLHFFFLLSPNARNGRTIGKIMEMMK